LRRFGFRLRLVVNGYDRQHKHWRIDDHDSGLTISRWRDVGLTNS
jgi:hypothetical protein